MTAPELSVVIASVNGLPYVGDCLESLASFAPDAEVIVADSSDDETRVKLRDAWPEVRLLTFDDPQTVPALRAAGVFAAQAPAVALIEDHCRVTPSWAPSLTAAHGRGHSVVGGPIRNVATKRIRDWAAFFCEYSRFMEPLPEGPIDDLTGMNVSYDRAALTAIDDLLREGRWETWLHPRLRERGFALYCAAGMVLEHDKDFGLGEFLSQRWHYSRSYAGMRNASLGRKRWLYALAAPLLPPLLYYRIARNVLARAGYGRQFALATPLVLAYTIMWAIGEVVGYVAGGGDSLLEVR